MVAKKNTIFQYMNGRLSCFLIKKISKIVNELTIRNLTIEETFLQEIAILKEDGNVVVNKVRYYFDGDKLILGGTAYERKN